MITTKPRTLWKVGRLRLDLLWSQWTLGVCVLGRRRLSMRRAHDDPRFVSGQFQLMRTWDVELGPLTLTYESRWKDCGLRARSTRRSKR